MMLLKRDLFSYQFKFGGVMKLTLANLSLWRVCIEILEGSKAQALTATGGADNNSLTPVIQHLISLSDSFHDTVTFCISFVFPCAKHYAKHFMASLIIILLPHKSPRGRYYYYLYFTGYGTRDTDRFSNLSKVTPSVSGKARFKTQAARLHILHS